jgi:uncharacterized protein (DUF885 family)
MAKPETRTRTLKLETSNAQVSFDRLARKYFDWVVRQFPEFATFLGIHDSDGKLTNFAPKAVEERRAKIREFRDAFKTLPLRGLDLESRVEKQLIVDQLEVQIALEKHWAPEECDPDLYIDSCVYGCYAITIRDVGDAPIAAAKMTERMASVPKVLAQGRKLIKNPTKINCLVAIASGEGAIMFFKDTVAKFAKRVKDGTGRRGRRRRLHQVDQDRPVADGD